MNSTALIEATEARYLVDPDDWSRDLAEHIANSSTSN